MKSIHVENVDTCYQFHTARNINSDNHLVKNKMDAYEHERRSYITLEKQ